MRRPRVLVGQASERGRKETNQDFHGAWLPDEPLLTTKGCAVALADGISTSPVSRAASESAVTGFFEDYYSTPEAWSVKTSAWRVLMAVNSWLHAQTRRSRYRYDADRGYVCTLSAIVFKSTTAHVFHVGDSRVYRLSGAALEQLTEDDRVRISAEESYLGAALGVEQHVELQYRSLPVEEGDVFVLVTDGVYEHADAGLMARIVREARASGESLDAAARRLVDAAHARGSPDNLTAQVVCVEALPEPGTDALLEGLAGLPFAPELDARTTFDGYRIVRKLHASHRSHVYLGVDEDTGARVALKTPSTELAEDGERLERFLLEEWVARRMNTPHVARALRPTRRRNYVYTVMEHVDGQTLSQWIIDHPGPDLDAVRGIVEQIAAGLRAFHRLEMVHQDLRPDNVMIDATGTVKLIDFGSTRVAGLVELAASEPRDGPLGTAQYSAPECLLGEHATARSDIFSLGVVAYEMLTGRLPYGTRVATARSKLDHLRLRYTSVLNYNPELPAWIDEPLRKALHPDPNKRYEALSELVFDLRRPRHAYAMRPRAPLIERNPVLFWQGTAALLAAVAAALAFALAVVTG